MEQGVKKTTYYELHREERKKYQSTYRETHLEDVRNKDKERKRKKYKGDRPTTSLVWKDNVVVKFE
jgi:hypothetical protein